MLQAIEGLAVQEPHQGALVQEAVAVVSVRKVATRVRKRSARLDSHSSNTYNNSNNSSSVTIHRLMRMNLLLTLMNLLTASVTRYHMAK
jgi:hypothetical protein